MRSNEVIVMTTAFSLCRRLVCAATLLCAMLATGVASAAGSDTNTTPPADRQSAPAGGGKVAPPRCVHGCLRWGKSCNVDPRGVYKCQRRCEKFGEICE
jgi:hypothetical protein